MAIRRHAARRDANEGEVVQALERVGALVMRLHEFDLLVCHRGVCHLLEVKMPQGRPTGAQRDMVRDGWPLRYVHDPIEALRAIGALR